MSKPAEDWFQEAMQTLAEQRKEEILDLLYRLDKLEGKRNRLMLDRLPPLSTDAERNAAMDNIRERIAVLENRSGLLT